MSNFVHLGIDCGDSGLRAAIVIDDIVQPLRLAPDLASGWVLFDPHSDSSSLGVGFPSLIRKLGSDTREVPQLKSIAQQRFEGVAATARKVTGKPIGVTVMALPAGLGHAKREALLGCAKSAGLENVSFVDKCTAAAIGHHGISDESSTALVFDLDYGDCEYAVVRLAMQRCRVIVAGNVPQSSGELLNANLIEAIVLALRSNPGNPIFLGLKQWKPEQWGVLRNVADSARRGLAEDTETEVVLLPELTRLKHPINVRVFRDGFAAMMKPIIDQTIGTLQQDLERHELELSDIDPFLVLGEVAQRSPAWDMISSAFSGRPQRAKLELVAAGAATYASQLGKYESAVELTSVEDLDSAAKSTQWSVEKTPVVTQEAKIAEVVAETVTPHHDVDQPTLAAARQLVDEGRFDHAERVLDGVVAQVDGLRKHIEAEREKSTGPGFLLQQARALVNAGDFQRAINLSHMANEQAPNDPDIFDGMIQIHVTSGLKLDRPEEFEQAKNILLCAHGHDQTNRSVHKALAKRHYQHALAMNEANKKAKAIEALEVALSFTPKDADANKLLQSLTESRE